MTFRMVLKLILRETIKVNEVEIHFIKVASITEQKWLLNLNVISSLGKTELN